MTMPKKKIPRVLLWLAAPLLRLAKALDLLVKLDRFEAQVLALGGAPEACLKRLDARAAELVGEGVDVDIAIDRASGEILDSLREGRDA